MPVAAAAKKPKAKSSTGSLKDALRNSFTRKGEALRNSFKKKSKKTKTDAPKSALTLADKPPAGATKPAPPPAASRPVREASWPTGPRKSSADATADKPGEPALKAASELLAAAAMEREEAVRCEGRAGSNSGADFERRLGAALVDNEKAKAECCLGQRIEGPGD